MNSKHTKPIKDSWDKLGALAPFATALSTILIAIVGWYFTQSYNKHQSDISAEQSRHDAILKEQQNRALELETIEKMIPHLTTNEESKRVSLIAIHDLGNPKLAIEMAELYPSEASIDVLQQLATVSDPKERVQAITAISAIAASGSSVSHAAEAALRTVFHNESQAVVELGMDSGNNRVLGAFVRPNGSILTEYDPSRVSDSIRAFLANEALLDATVEGRNEASRLAILKVPGSAYPFLKLATSMPAPGTLVIALGNRGDIRVGSVESITEKRIAIRFPNAGSFRGMVGVPVLNMAGEIVGLLKFYKDETIVMIGVRGDLASKYVDQNDNPIKMF